MSNTYIPSWQHWNICKCKILYVKQLCFANFNSRFFHSMQKFIILVFKHKRELAFVHGNSISLRHWFEWNQFISILHSVSDKPICGHLHRVVQGVGKDRVSKVICPVLSHPAPVSFSWTFNSSMDTHSVSKVCVLTIEWYSANFYFPL